nr:uncharacterized protein LOC111419038 isoform X2 [Onthophagus taurus]
MNLSIQVEVLISDMGTNLMELSSLLNVTPDNPKTTLDGQEIFYYFDSPHMIKTIRNMMLKNRFCGDGYQTAWKYIVDFYNSNSKLQNRLAPKLTKQHFDRNGFERQKVKSATQVISNTVASGLATYIYFKYQKAEQQIIALTNSSIFLTYQMVKMRVILVLKHNKNTSHICKIRLTF